MYGRGIRGGIRSGIKKMVQQENKCKNCNCICHCSLEEHSDMYGVCSCTACACSHEIVVDDTNECDTCQ